MRDPALLVCCSSTRQSVDKDSHSKAVVGEVVIKEMEAKSQHTLGIAGG